MMARLMVVFQIVGALVSVLGMVLVLLWIMDVFVTKVLRATKTFGLLLRFVWIGAPSRAKIRADMEEEERKRKLPYEPPVDDEMSDDEERESDT